MAGVVLSGSQVCPQPSRTPSTQSAESMLGYIKVITDLDPKPGSTGSLPHCLWFMGSFDVYFQ